MRNANDWAHGYPFCAWSSWRARLTMCPVGTLGAQAATQLSHVRQVESGPSAMSRNSSRPSIASLMSATRPRAVSHSTGLTAYAGQVAWQSEHLLHSLAAS